MIVRPRGGVRGAVVRDAWFGRAVTIPCPCWPAPERFVVTISGFELCTDCVGSDGGGWFKWRSLAGALNGAHTLERLYSEESCLFGKPNVETLERRGYGPLFGAPCVNSTSAETWYVDVILWTNFTSDDGTKRGYFAVSQNPFGPGLYGDQAFLGTRPSPPVCGPWHMTQADCNPSRHRNVCSELASVSAPYLNIAADVTIEIDDNP